MPSWGIHLKLSKKLNDKLNLNNDLFTFSNLIPDVDSDSLYTRRDAHYYIGIRFNNRNRFKEIFDWYEDGLNNPMIIGYYCHIEFVNLELHLHNDIIIKRVITNLYKFVIYCTFKLN